MECPRCGLALAANARFCLECGAERGADCPHCGAYTTVGQKFCGSCGTALIPGVRTVRDIPLSLGDLIPTDLSRRVLGARSEVEGELKLVSVLFADITDSTSLIEKLDPEQAVAVLHPAIRTMIDAVHEYDGTVNKLQGDGIMALFGAPLAHEDHALRACYAALAMQRAVADLPNFGLSIRVGIHSGRVLVHYIKTDLTIEYEADGPTVHLASRMEQLAKPGEICITSTTYDLAQEYIRARPLGEIQVKGISVPVSVFRLTSRAGARNRWDASLSRGLHRLVGRASELRSLADRLTQAQVGNGGVLSIVGDAGIGKSRLLHEFLRASAKNGCSVFETSASPFGTNAPYQPVSRLLRAWFGVTNKDSQQEISEKVRSRIQSVGSDLLSKLPAFHTLLDLPIDDADWLELSAPRRKQEIIELIKTMVLRRAETGPVVLAFEDLHWVDAETQAVLDNLIKAIDSTRLLVALTYRPEYQHSWKGLKSFDEIRLGALTSTESADLLDEILGPDSSLGAVKRMLIETSDGIPLFLEELVQSLVASGAIEGKAGSYRLSNPVATLDMPKTVQAVIAARIDRLPKEQKELLQIASVVGREAPIDLLERLLDLSRHELSLVCAALDGADLLYQVGLPPDELFVFKHALTQEVAYESLLIERRRALHAHIAEIIEQLYGDRLEEHIELAVHHAMAGRSWDKAATFARLAGLKSMARSAFGDAVRFFDETIAALKKLPGDRDISGRLLDAHMKLRDALTPTGDIDRVVRCLKVALEIAISLDDVPTLAAIHIGNSMLRNFAGDLDGAVYEGRQARKYAESSGVITLLIGSSYALGQAYWFQGAYDNAVKILSADLDHFTGPLRTQKFGTGTGLVIHNSTLSVVLAERGEFEEAIARSKDALEIATNVDRPFDIAFASHAFGFVRNRCGQTDPAIPALERGLEVSRQHKIGLLLPWNLAELGYAYALVGRLDEGEAVLERAVAQAQQSNVRYIEAQSTVMLGTVYLLSSKIDNAIRYTEQGLECARRFKYRGVEATGLRTLGLCSILQKLESIARAKAELTKALSLANELGMKPEVGHCWAALGRYYAAKGSIPESENAFAKANELFRGLGAPYWTQRIESSSTLGNGIRG